MEIFRESFVLPIANIIASGVEKRISLSHAFQRNNDSCIPKDRMQVISKPLSHFSLLPPLLLVPCCPFGSATDHTLILHSYNCLHIFPSSLTCEQYLST